MLQHKASFKSSVLMLQMHQEKNKIKILIAQEKQ